MQRLPGSASTAPTRTRCPRGNAVQSWRLPGRITAMLQVTESERPTSALPLSHSLRWRRLTFNMQLLNCLDSKRSHTHILDAHTHLGVTSAYTCPVLSIQWLYTMQSPFSFPYKKKKTAKGSYFVLYVSKANEMWEETAWERRIAWKHFCLENVSSCNWVNYILPN